jgi:hypothetical protein
MKFPPQTILDGYGSVMALVEESAVKHRPNNASDHKESRSTRTALAPG